MTIRSGLAAAVLTVAVVLAGCSGPKFYVEVSGLKDAQAPEKRSYVLRPGTKAVDPDDLQFKEFATYANRALQDRGYLPAREGAAEVVIFLSYGVGDPKTTYYSAGLRGAFHTRTDFFRWASLEAVDADVYAKTQKVVQLWRTTMLSDGASGDLRIIFPILIAAGQPYLAANTGQQVLKVLTDDSPEVLAIRGEPKL
ncbi:DUF4136 domain-containing protein [soil metagenome]